MQRRIVTASSCQEYRRSSGLWLRPRVASACESESKRVRCTRCITRAGKEGLSESEGGRDRPRAKAGASARMVMSTLGERERGRARERARAYQK
eukprot:6184587-Pleurochrysis_carterae.AAC.1